MKIRFNQLVSILLVTIIVLLSVLLVSCSDKEDIALTNFAASETCFVVGNEATVVFTVETAKGKSVDLCADDNSVLTKMLDNGQGVDTKENDGIYTCSIDVANDIAESNSYYAVCGEIKSDIIVVSCFEKPTEDAQAEYLEIKSELDNIEAKFDDDNGNTPREQIEESLSQAEEYAEELVRNDKAISFEKTESSVVIKLSSGLTFVYAPKIEGTYSGSDDEAMTIAIYQPYYDWVSTISDNYISLPGGIGNEAELLGAAADDLVEVFDDFNYSQDTLYLNNEVTLDTIKEFDKNQIILWQGHGTYAGNTIHSVVCTGAEFNWDAWFWDVEYFLDCCQDRIVNVDGNEAISHKFINKYCDDLENTFVYLGPCESGHDDVLANAFLEKNASAVIANTQTILCRYGDMIEYTTASLLAQVNEETGNYYTLSEALAEAKKLYGNDDSKYGGKGAIPTIFGGDDANNYRLGDYETVAVTDFTIPTDEILTLGELSVIEPEIVPEGATDYTIEWSSSDESIATVSPTGEAGIITSLAKGTTTITAKLTSGGKTITKTTNLRVASKSRDTILVLDVSGSMYGTPMEEMKKSAIQFCKDLLQDEYNNRVGLVFYDDGITTVNLTDDLNQLIYEIEAISDGGMTNMESGLSTADTMMQNQGKSDAIKNVVIMADGLPNDGKTSYSGSMPSGSYSGYYASVSYANAVIDTAKDMMTRYNMYSLGFFHSLYEEEKDFGVALMQQLTNQEDGYHQVDNAEDLQFAFGDISETINVGSKIVINIACPVDVEVSYGGEKLSSAADSYCDSTSFGTLQVLGKNKDIKVVSLDDDKEYEVKLTGTGKGTMDYSVCYFDENEKMSDYRSFEAVPITMTTVIKSNTNNDKDVTLNIDEDGDGEVDTIWTALANSVGEITFQKYPPELEEISKEISEDTSYLTIILVIVAIIVIAGCTAGIIVAVSFKGRNQESEEDIIPVREQEKPEMYNKGAETEDKETEDKTPNVGRIQVTSGSMNGFSVSIHDGETLYLGRDPKFANIVITEDYAKVSRIHCTVTYNAEFNKYYVTDCSRNGTFLISRKRLTKGKRTPLNSNTILILANDNCTILLG